MTKRKMLELICDSTSQKQNNFISDLLKSALSSYKSRNYSSAIEQLNKILILDLNCTHAYLLKISSLSGLNRCEEAIDCCNTAIINCPNDNIKFYNNKAVLLYKVGKIQASISCYDTALKQNPDFPEIYYNFANLLHELDGYEEAIRYYDRALELQPNYTNARNNRELAHNKLIHFKNVAEDINILGEINVKDGNTET